MTAHKLINSLAKRADALGLNIEKCTEFPGVGVDFNNTHGWIITGSSPEIMKGVIQLIIEKEQTVGLEVFPSDVMPHPEHQNYFIANIGISNGYHRIGS